MSENKHFQDRIKRIEALIRETETIADAEARSCAVELVHLILELHGDGLNRILEIVSEAGASGPAAVDALARDERVSALLLIHGLHPSDLETRLTHALERLRSHGVTAQFLGISQGVARLRLVGNPRSCQSSAGTLKQTIEEAIYVVAPELDAIEIEEVERPSPSTFVPLTQLTTQNDR